MSAKSSVRSAKSNKSKKSPKKQQAPKELKDLVKKEHRLTHSEVHAYLVDLIEAAQRV